MVRCFGLLALFVIAASAAAQPAGQPEGESGLWLTSKSLGLSEHGPDRFVLSHLAPDLGRVPLGHTDAATEWENRHLVHKVRADYTYAGKGEFRGALGCEMVSASNPVTELDLRATVTFHDHPWRLGDVKLTLLCAGTETPFTIPLDLEGVALAAGDELVVAVMTPIPNPSTAGISNLYLTAGGEQATTLVAPWTRDALLEPLELNNQWPSGRQQTQRFLWATDAPAVIAVLEGESTRGQITARLLDPASENLLTEIRIDQRGQASDAPPRAFRDGAIVDAGHRTRWLVEVDYGTTNTGNVTFRLDPVVPPSQSTTVTPAPAPAPPTPNGGAEPDPHIDADAGQKSTPSPGVLVVAVALAAAVVVRRR